MLHSGRKKSFNTGYVYTTAGDEPSSPGRQMSPSGAQTNVLKNNNVDVLTQDGAWALIEILSFCPRWNVHIAM